MYNVLYIYTYYLEYFVTLLHVSECTYRCCMLLFTPLPPIRTPRCVLTLSLQNKALPISRSPYQLELVLLPVGVVCMSCTQLMDASARAAGLSIHVQIDLPGVST